MSDTPERQLPPAHLLTRVGGDPSAEAFAGSFPHIRSVVTSFLGRAGYKLSSFHEILDFGCGVGRFMLAMEDTLAPDQRLWGCDVHEECVHWCQQNIGFAQTAKNALDPPLPFADQQFDFVYACSVYTHLRLDQQFRWAWEIHRVLRPGGVLFTTLHGTMFFPLFDGVRPQTELAEMYSFGSDGLFGYVGFPHGEQSLDQGVHIAAAHNPSFVRDQFSAFDVVKWFPQTILAGGQDIWVLRRPEHGRCIARPLGAPERCSWTAEVSMRPPNHATELSFQVEAHRRFRVHAVLEPAGHYWIEFPIEIHGASGILAAETIRLATNRILGRSHFHTLDLMVPAHRGDVTVRLGAVCTDAGSLGSEDAKVTWWFPHFH